MSPLEMYYASLTYRRMWLAARETAYNPFASDVVRKRASDHAVLYFRMYRMAVRGAGI